MLDTVRDTAAGMDQRRWRHHLSNTCQACLRMDSTADIVRYVWRRDQPVDMLPGASTVGVVSELLLSSVSADRTAGCTS